MKATFPLGIATMLLVLGTSSTFAANLSVCPVGCPFSTIQGAVDAAGAGDTLLIGKGHYFENVVIVSKRITLQGAGRRITVIDGNDIGTVITVGDRNGAPRTIVTLSDLTITRGSAPSGGGIFVAPGASLALHHSIVSGNHAKGPGEGGGLFMASDNPLSIDDTTFSNNDAGSGGGIFASGENATVVISNSTFSDNHALVELGGGIAVSYSRSNVTLTNLNIVNNTAVTGGGAYLSSELAGPIVVENVVAAGNSASAGGGGLLFLGLASLTHVVIAHNTSGTQGGGLRFDVGDHQFQIRLNDAYVVQNTAAIGGGGIFNGESLVLSGSVIADNQPDNCENSPGGTGCP